MSSPNQNPNQNPNQKKEKKKPEPKTCSVCAARINHGLTQHESEKHPNPECTWPGCNFDRRQDGPSRHDPERDAAVVEHIKGHYEGNIVSFHDAAESRKLWRCPWLPPCGLPPCAQTFTKKETAVRHCLFVHHRKEAERRDELRQQQQQPQAPSQAPSQAPRHVRGSQHQSEHRAAQARLDFEQALELYPRYSQTADPLPQALQSPPFPPQNLQRQYSQSGVPQYHLPSFQALQSLPSEDLQHNLPPSQGLPHQAESSQGWQYQYSPFQNLQHQPLQSGDLQHYLPLSQDLQHQYSQSQVPQYHSPSSQGLQPLPSEDPQQNLPPFQDLPHQPESSQDWQYEIPPSQDLQSQDLQSQDLPIPPRYSDQEFGPGQYQERPSQLSPWVNQQHERATQASYQVWNVPGPSQQQQLPVQSQHPPNPLVPPQPEEEYFAPRPEERFAPWAAQREQIQRQQVPVILHFPPELEEQQFEQWGAQQEQGQRRELPAFEASQQQQQQMVQAPYQDSLPLPNPLYLPDHLTPPSFHDENPEFGEQDLRESASPGERLNEAVQEPVLESDDGRSTVQEEQQDLQQEEDQENELSEDETEWSD